MVTLSTADFTTLQFTDSSGNLISADPVSDPNKYNVFSATESAQAGAPGINANREANYNTGISNYNASVSIGRTPNPSTPPNKPTYLTVGDPVLNAATNTWSVGKSTEGPWPHALTDPLAPIPQAVQGITGLVAAGSGKPVFATDQLSSVLAAIQGLGTALASINTVLGKIAAKEGVV